MDVDDSRPQRSGKTQYRLQLPPDGHWTEWRDIDVSVTEPHVLSMQVSEWISKLNMNGLCRSLPFQYLDGLAGP